MTPNDSTPDGRTTAQRDQAGEPQLPHERDQTSTGQTAKGQDRVIRQAKADLDHGQADTDRKPAMEQAYEQQKSGGDAAGDASGAGVRKTGEAEGPGDRKSTTAPRR